MDSFLEYMIAFLNELKNMSPFLQAVTVAGIPSFFTIMFAVPVWIVLRKAKASISAYDACERRWISARDKADQLQKEVTLLKSNTPESFIVSHTREISDGNQELALSLSKIFLEQQEDALILAYRTLMEGEIRNSIQDGPPAFEAARNWAFAQLALTPQEQFLQLLIEDLTDAAHIAKSSKLNVTIKSNEDRIERLQKIKNLNLTLENLIRCYREARYRGQYALLLLFADYGVALTSRSPYGVGSREHILMRSDRLQALTLCGQLNSARQEAKALLPEFIEFFGDYSLESSDVKHLIGNCLLEMGNALGALNIFKEILPIRTDILGERHRIVLLTQQRIGRSLLEAEDPKQALAILDKLLLEQVDVLGEADPDTLTTRHIIGRCQLQMGHYRSALKTFLEILPVRVEVQGDRHPEVLVLRQQMARCQLEAGDAAGAQKSVRALLQVHADVMGDSHPNVLTTRNILGRCQLACGDAAGALITFQEVLRVGIHILGDRHPEMHFARRRIAECFWEIDDSVVAPSMPEVLSQIDYELLGEQLGPGHSNEWMKVAGSAVASFGKVVETKSDVSDERNPP